MNPYSTLFKPKSSSLQLSHLKFCLDQTCGNPCCIFRHTLNGGGIRPIDCRSVDGVSDCSNPPVCQGR